MSSAATAAPRVRLGVLVVMSASVFANVASQFMPAGLFPQMARAFDTNEAALGGLVAVFSVSNMLAGPPLAHLTRRMPRKTVLLVTIAVLAFATLLAAVAPTFAVLAVARVIGGAGVALSQAVIIGYVARLVPKSSLNRSNAIVAGGGVAAALTAVPIGIALGQVIGWQLTLGGLAVLIAVMAAVLGLVVPAVPVIASDLGDSEPVALRRDRTVLPVLLYCLSIALIGGGAFTLYTFIDPYFSRVAGLTPHTISALLLAYAVGGVAGLVVSGAIGDKAPRGILFGGLVVGMLAIGALALWPSVLGVAAIALAVWGFAMSSNSVGTQSLIMHTASPSARDVAASWLGSAQNLGVAAGASLGSLLLAGSGVGSLPGGALVVWLVALAFLPVVFWVAARRGGTAEGVRGVVKSDSEPSAT